MGLKFYDFIFFFFSSIGSESVRRLSGSSENRETSERAEKRKKKKSYYAKLKKQEDDKMAELAAKYRDRAKERRDGHTGERPDDSEGSAGGAGGGAYRAVAPDVKSSYDAAERRKQMIQESKFLGGDMEHTHLVKGLDFALLQKVRSEIANRESEEAEEILAEEAAASKATSASALGTGISLASGAEPVLTDT